MRFRADPGGVFASDTHRRVLAHLPLPGNDPMPVQGSGRKLHAHSLGHRISADAFHQLETVDDLNEVLQELEAEGFAAELKDGWKQTKAGLEALQAPLPQEPTGPAEPVVLGGLEA